MSLRLRSTPCQTVAAPVCLRRSARGCVLRQGQARRAAGRSGGSQTATTGSDTWSSSEGGSESDNSDVEASSGGRGHGHGNRRASTQQQQNAGGGQQQGVGASGYRSGAAGAAAAAAVAAPEPDQGRLHQPYSHFFWSCSQLKPQHVPRIALGLCTDIPALHSMNGSCSIKVLFQKHPADWDIGEYILQHTVMQQQEQLQASGNAAGSTSSSQVLGPYNATVMLKNGNTARMTGLPLASIRQSLECDGHTHVMILTERLSSNHGPCFLLHTMPARSGSPELGNETSTSFSHSITRAGEGPGLQVFPGSVSEVQQPATITKNNSKVQFSIPKPLILSQLPAIKTPSVQVMLILCDCLGQQVQQWQVPAVHTSRSHRIAVSKSHDLAEYVGRPVATASLSHDATQGIRLTLTLAPTADDPAAVVAADGPATVPAAAAPTLHAAGVPAAAVGLLPAAGTPAAPHSEAADSGVRSAAAAAAASALADAPAAPQYLQPGREESASQPSVAPPQPQPVLSAKRPAEQLEEGEQQGEGSIAAAAATTAELLSAAAEQPPALPIKKPRLQLPQLRLLRQPSAGAYGAPGSPNNLCLITPQAATATATASLNEAACATLATPAATGDTCIPMQVDPPAPQQQQQPPVAEPQQRPQQLQQQQEPGGQSGAAAILPHVPPVLPGCRASHTAVTPVQLPGAAVVPPAWAAAAVAAVAVPAALSPAAIAAAPRLSAATAPPDVHVKQEAPAPTPVLTSPAPAAAAVGCGCSSGGRVPPPPPPPPAAAAAAAAVAAAAPSTPFKQEACVQAPTLTPAPMLAAPAATGVRPVNPTGHNPSAAVPPAPAAAAAGSVNAGHNASAAVPPAAARPAPAVVKQEVELVDLTAASDDGDDEDEQQPPVPRTSKPAASRHAAPPRTPTPALLAPPQQGAPAGATAAAAAAAAAAVAAPAPAALAFVDLAPAAAAQPQQLPAGLMLPDARSLEQMELQLGRLMTSGLQGLLPDAQYCRLLDQLRVAFDPLRLAAAVDPGQQERLELMYAYVQAAVRMGRLDRVVDAIKSLVAVACRAGGAMVVE